MTPKPGFQFLIFLIFIFQSTVMAKEKTLGPVVYSFKNLKMETVRKKEYEISELIQFGVFPVPVDNAIGTNNHTNGITLMKFKDNFLFDGIWYNTVKEDFSDHVGGGGCVFMPFISDELIGWGQTSRFLLYNFKNNSHKYYDISAIPQRWEYINWVGTLDSKKPEILFVIDSGGGASDLFLKSYDFSTDPPRESRLYDLIRNKVPFRNFPYVYQGIIFLYSFEHKKLIAIDSKFNPVHHPLLDLYNGNRDTAGKSNRYKIHPTLPFGVLAGKNKLWVVKWEDPQKPEMIPLIYFPPFDRHYSFSPDGKWLTIHHINNFKWDSKTNKNELYVMPVNEELPYYLDHPTRLEPHSEKLDTKKIWSSNPTSLNVVGYDKLYHWIIEPEDD